MVTLAGSLYPPPPFCSALWCFTWLAGPWWKILASLSLSVSGQNCFTSFYPFECYPIFHCCVHQLLEDSKIPFLSLFFCFSVNPLYLPMTIFLALLIWLSIIIFLVLLDQWDLIIPWPETLLVYHNHPHRIWFYMFICMYLLHETFV